MELNHLSTREKLVCNAVQIAINFQRTQYSKISSCQRKEALFHDYQKKAFENIEENLGIMLDFLYGKNAQQNRTNFKRYQAVKAVANVYLLKFMIYELNTFKSKRTFNCGILQDKELNFQATLAFLATNIEEHIFDALECIAQYHANPALLAVELNEVLIDFKDYINPYIIENIFTENKPISIIDIYNGKWQKHQYLHYLVYGGVYRKKVNLLPLEKLLDKLKYCKELLVA